MDGPFFSNCCFHFFMPSTASTLLLHQIHFRFCNNDRGDSVSDQVHNGSSFTHETVDTKQECKTLQRNDLKR